MPNPLQKKAKPKTKWSLEAKKPTEEELMRLTKAINNNIQKLLNTKLKSEIAIALTLLLKIISDSEKATVHPTILLAMQQHLNELFSYLNRNAIKDHKEIDKSFIKLHKDLNKFISWSFPTKKSQTKISFREKALLANFTMPMIALTFKMFQKDADFNITDQNNYIALKLFALNIAALDKNFIKFDREKVSFITREIQHMMENGDE